MKTKIYKRGNGFYYYQIEICNNEYTSPKTTKCRTKKDALLFVQSLQDNKKQSSFKDYAENFFNPESSYSQWKLINNRALSPETVDAYIKRLNNQVIPYFKNYSLENIKRKDVKDFIIWSSKKWSLKTANCAQSVLNIILKQAVEEELIPFNPCAGLSFRKIPKKSRVILTQQEVKKVYSADGWTTEDLRKMFLIAAVTGMRISEIVGLRNCDIQQNYINVRHSYSRKHGLGNTKTKECRYVPIPEGLRISGNGSPESYCFLTKFGKPYNITRMYDNLIRICNANGIDTHERKISTHTLRNFFITYLQDKGIPEAKIRAVAGHKDSTMTGLYTYWTPDMFPEVYKAQQELYDFIVLQS